MTFSKHIGKVDYLLPGSMKKYYLFYPELPGIPLWRKLIRLFMPRKLHHVNPMVIDWILIFRFSWRSNLTLPLLTYPAFSWQGNLVPLLLPVLVIKNTTYTLSDCTVSREHVGSGIAPSEATGVVATNTGSPCCTETTHVLKIAIIETVAINGPLQRRCISPCWIGRPPTLKFWIELSFCRQAPAFRTGIVDAIFALP